MRGLTKAALCAAAIVLVCACTASSALADGALGWGSNQENQLGNNWVTTTPTAATVGNLAGVTAVATAGGHSMAIAAGQLVTWGTNKNGQGGTGTTANHALPAATGLEGVVAIAAGKEFGLALLSSGVVKSFGRNNLGQLGLGVKVGPEECGTLAEHPSEIELEEHACSTVPRTVPGVTAASISAGECHALVVLTSGKVESWGCNRDGQLGDGTSSGPQACRGSFSIEPCSTSPVESGELSGAKKVAAGGRFSLALVGEGEVWGWGENGSGQLGIGASSPSKCPQPFFGEVACSLSPVHVHVLETASAIAAGESHALAIQGGKLYSWGANGSGQLGLGSTTSVNEATEVPGAEPLAISAGGNQSAKLVAGERVEEAGANGSGQLGDGTETNKTSFTKAITTELHGVATGGLQTIVFGTPGTTVTSVSPPSGPSPGGTTVTIKGEHLAGVKEVLFGPAASPKVEFVSETEIRAESPAEKPSTRNVVVIATRSTSAATAASKFTFEPSGTLQFGHCFKQAGGKYKRNGCTEEAASGGAWEWSPGVVKGGFTVSLLPETTVGFETTTLKKLACTGISGGGAFAHERSVEGVVLHFTGCKWEGVSCSTAGAAEGEIETNTLEGAVGYLEVVSNNLGVQLAPASGEVWFSATCGSEKVAIKGGAIGSFTPVNSTTNGFTFRFRQNKGKQSKIEFDEPGAPKETLVLQVNEGLFSTFNAAIELEAKTANEESLEANTTL